MKNLNDLLIFEHENEHGNEHDLEHKSEHNLSKKKKFSTPKIYSSNGSIKARWYVYYSFRDPTTGKLVRQKNIYGNVNLYKTKEERFNVLSSYKRNLQKLLKEGFDPYANNIDLFINKNKVNNTEKKIGLESETSNIEKSDNKTIPILKDPKQVEITSTTPNPEAEVHISEDEESKMTLREAFDFALKMKEKLLKPRTLQDYRNRSKVFIKWLNEEYPDIKHADEITRMMCMNFLNQHLIKNTPRSRNNSRVDLGSMMQVLEDNEIMPVNVMRKTPVLRDKPERHKRYDAKTLEAIFTYLEKEDPILLLYIKFISYNFLRPIEVCRLRIKDLNLETKTLSFKAKNSYHKTKIIPSLILEALPDLSKLPGENPLITPYGIGKEWDTKIDNKRDYFSKRFNKTVKKKFNLGKDHALYSFRHTFITKLYRKLEEESSPFEAKSVLMNITGHTSMTALEKYLRDTDAHLPSDYSDLIR